MGDFEYAQGAGFGSRVPLRGGWEGGGRARPRRARGGVAEGSRAPCTSGLYSRGSTSFSMSAASTPGFPSLSSSLTLFTNATRASLYASSASSTGAYADEPNCLTMVARVARVSLAAFAARVSSRVLARERTRRPTRRAGVVRPDGRGASFLAPIPVIIRSKGRSRARSVPSVVWAAEIIPPSRIQKEKSLRRFPRLFPTNFRQRPAPPGHPFRGRGWRARLRGPHSLSALARALGNARKSSAGAVSPGEERVLACASAPLLPGRRLFANRESRVRITLAGARASVLRRDSHGRPLQRARKGARRQG